jgi:6-phosphogluconolactonase (cycloisomerase 2 family)
MKARIFTALCVALMGLTGCIKGEKNFFYVTGPGTNEVFGFTLHSDGSLTALNTPNFTTGSRPAALAIHPPGDFFYIANSAGANITLLDINTGNGELVVPPTNSALPPVTPPNIFGAGASPIAMVIAPNAPRLYAANRDSGDISAYLIDPTNGNLGVVPGSPFKVNPDPTATSPTNPQSIAISPNGSFLYTANPTQGTIAGFAVASDGSLTPVPGSPFAVGTAGTSPSFLAVHPGGAFLYAADPVNNAVLGFSIAGNGAISPISGSPFAAGVGTSAFSITPQGSFLYASNSGDNTVSGYSINNSGALTQVSGSPFLTGGNVPGYVLATGSFVYVADQGTNDIAGFVIASSGTLTKVKGSPFPVAVSPSWLIASAEPQ